MSSVTQKKNLPKKRTIEDKQKSLDDSSFYINRELSQLEFNFRVLAQAKDTSVPILERLRFLCISCSNLDEFFEIRVASLKQQQAYGHLPCGPDGLMPNDALAKVRERSRELVEAQYQHWNKILRPALAREGIRFLLREEWNEKQRRWLNNHFREQILPVLSPLGLDPSHPFPRILNKSLNVAVVVKGTDAFGREAHMALVRAPRSLPRIIRIPAEVSGNGNDFVLLSGVLHAFVDELFPGMKVLGSYQFRVTRDSELLVDEEEVENLASALKDELHSRGFARAVRLEVAASTPKNVRTMLAENFELPSEDVFRCKGPVNLVRVIEIYDLVDRPELKFPSFKPRVQSRLLEHDNLFTTLQQGDVLLHHPYDTFSTVVEWIRSAAQDPQVLAIKQTLYRTGNSSPIVAALIEAARAGKDVTVVIELRARFDEEANISLANRLQEAGVQVVYGVVGYKTHAKMLLMIRREGGKLKRYAHLSTGNYHLGTARAYTDIGLLTAHQELTEDVASLFQQLSGLGPHVELNKMLYSPFTLHTALLQKIEREIEHANAGKPARIIAKFNGLNEAGVIRALYLASNAGVKIDLIVRGTCALRPGIKGVSENISVRSVVGRFLEHSRVYYFHNNAEPEVFCSSADWLERNLLRRIETCFPILDPELKRRIVDEELENYLADNTQAWALASDGSYHRVEAGDAMPHSAQMMLLSRLC